MVQIDIVHRNYRWVGVMNAAEYWPNSTQEATYQQAKAWAEVTVGGAEIAIHGLDGKIREKNTINGPDHYPPKG